MLSFSKKRENVIPTTAVFPEVDIGSLSRSLRLEERGQEAGQHDLPQTVASVLDATESEIVNEVERIRREGLNRYSSAMESYTRRIESIPFEVESAKSLRREIETDYLQISRERSNALVSLQEDMEESVKEYRHYRKLHRRVTTPKKKVPAFHFWALVGAIAVIETAVNGFFFAANNINGLLGGMLIAGGITVINVIASYALGRFVTWKNHISAITRICGYFFTLVYLGFLVLFSLAVGHYRESYATLSPLQAPEAALASLLQQPFQFSGLDSWALVLLTAMISLIVFWKGYNRDDPYPGYYDMWSRMRDARDQYEDGVIDAHDELQEARNDAIKRLDIQRNDFKAVVEDSRAARAAQARMPEQLHEFLHHTERGVRQLLAVYRQENTKSRKTQTPAYFDEEFCFSTEIPVSVEESGGAIDNEEIERVNASFDSTIDSIGDRFEKSIVGFDAIVAQHKEEVV